MNTYTLGPWSVEQGENIRLVVSLTDECLWNPLVAEVASNADARLIAAAPEMLEVLKAYTTAFGDDHIKGHGGNDCFHCDARALLAKIVGGK